MNTVRSEKDSMGAIDVPADKLWGAQTQRSLEHFRISTEKMPTSLIHALALTKRAAAKVNEDLGLLSEEKASAIRQAADEAAFLESLQRGAHGPFREFGDVDDGRDLWIGCGAVVVRAVREVDEHGLRAGVAHMAFEGP